MRNKAAASAAMVLVCVSLFIAIVFACVSRDWLFTKPQTYETLAQTESAGAALEFVVSGLFLAVPYLLFRSRAWGIVGALIGGATIALHGTVITVRSPSIGGAMSIVFALLAAACATWYLIVLRNEQKHFNECYQEDGVDLRPETKAALHRMSASPEISGARKNLSKSFYVWTILAVLAVALSAVIVQETVFTRNLSVETTATISRVVTSDNLVDIEEDFDAATQNLLVVTEFPDAQCDSVSPETVQSLELVEGSSLAVLVEPSSLECEVLAEPYPPFWVLSLSAPLFAFAVTEAARAYVRTRRRRTLGSLEYATPLFAVTKEGKQSFERLRNFDDRIVIEMDSLVDLEHLNVAHTAPERCVPMSQYSSGEFGEGARYRDSAFDSHRVLTVTRIQHTKEAPAEPELDESIASDGGEAVVHEPTKVQAKVQAESGPLRARTRATGGPYYLVPGTYAMDKVLIVDPQTKEVLECRLLGGAVGEEFAFPNPFDLITYWN